MWRHVTLVRTDISDEPIASIIRVRRIRELGTLAISSKCDKLQKILNQLILCTLMLDFPLKRLFLQEQRGVTSQKTTFFRNQTFWKMFLLITTESAVHCCAFVDFKFLHHIHSWQDCLDKISASAKVPIYTQDNIGIK
jgi:hypothetical protein